MYGPGCEECGLTDDKYAPGKHITGVRVCALILDCLNPQFGP